MPDHREKARSVLQGLFKEQRQAVLDKCRYKVIWTTRRAGKTTTPISDFVAKGLIYPNSRFAFIARTRQSAEDIAWPIMLDLDMRHGIGMKPQEAKLRMRIPGNSMISLYGADRPGWMSKLYGQKLRGVAIDEAAFYTTSLQDIISDVLGPTLTDLGGTLYLCSIPGHLPRGLFWALTKEFDHRETFFCRTPSPSPSAPDALRYSVHTWTTDSNPHMAEQFQQEIAEAKAANPDVENDPSFMRNFRKAWVQTLGEQVYPFDETINTYPGEWQPSPEDRYVLGIDLGWTDSTATSLCVWRDGYPILVELDSWKQKEVLLSTLAKHVRSYMDQYKGKSFYIVADPAHRQLFETFRREFNLPIMEAEKAQKHDAIRVAAEMLRSGRALFCDPAGSPHVEEMQDLVWRYRADGTRHEQPGLPNDCSDAYIMAMRHAMHYLQREEEPIIPDAKETRLRERKALIEEEIRHRDFEERAWNDF